MSNVPLLECVGDAYQLFLEISSCIFQHGTGETIAKFTDGMGLLQKVLAKELKRF